MEASKKIAGALQGSRFMVQEGMPRAPETFTTLLKARAKEPSCGENEVHRVLECVLAGRQVATIDVKHNEGSRSKHLLETS